MANYEATRYDFDAANVTGIEGINTGIIVPWGSASIPSGFLECDGSAVSRTTYANLFAVIGTTYGSGDGSTTFNLPDLDDKIVVGRSPTRALATANTNTVAPITGNVAGSAANATVPVNLIGPHSHSGVSPITGSSKSNNGPQQNKDFTNPDTGAAGGGGAHSHNLSANFVGDDATITQPNVITQYIIKT